MGIKCYESKLNLQWKPILKNILADPVGFVEQGGWDFLDMEVRQGGHGREGLGGG
jgi:nucleosome binding factor SPN SPT16 subunit